LNMLVGEQAWVRALWEIVLILAKNGVCTPISRSMAYQLRPLFLPNKLAFLRRDGLRLWAAFLKSKGRL
jgi:hypothetical protein